MSTTMDDVRRRSASRAVADRGDALCSVRRIAPVRSSRDQLVLVLRVAHRIARRRAAFASDDGNRRPATQFDEAADR
jgi:hypothetical protein